MRLRFKSFSLAFLLFVLLTLTAGGLAPGVHFPTERGISRTSSAGEIAGKPGREETQPPGSYADVKGDTLVATALNVAAIVFREGLEAVLILASLMGSLKRGSVQKFRRPLWIGAWLSLGATFVTWVLAAEILRALAGFGERLEALVSLLAIGVLLLITNWFFHKTYWTGWIATFHSRKQRLLSAEAGQALGLVLLGFSSVYREGFEVVLFSQSIILRAGSVPVTVGVGLGLLGTILVGLAVFGLQVSLPYKKLLIATGVLIGWVLIILVGNTVDVLQTVAWLPLHPLGAFRSPTWLILVAGFFPTWEGLLAQLAAATLCSAATMWPNASVTAQGVKLPSL